MSLRRTVPVAIALGVLMYLPAVGLRSVLSHWLEANPGDPPSAWVRIAAYGALAMIAMAAMAVGASDGGWRQFGFCAARRGWWLYAAGAALTGVVSSLLLKLGNGSGLDTAMAGVGAGTLIAMIVVATLVEELFVRGWMLGFLEPIAARTVRIGSLAVSVRVLTGAVFFAAMHLTLAKTSIDRATFAVIIGFTVLLGILCGIAREKTGSLVPAIATHFAGNLGGIAGGIVYMVVMRAPPVTG